ncbi:MAG: hypothetical protein IJI45_03630 [Anaerolineaceae bacterium]|nr:hypothetical protein [Anaerolineaceae bacterium]
MLNTAVKQNNLLLKDTIDMLFGLDDEKLMEVQSMIKGFEDEDEDLLKDLYKPLTEAELIEQIDRGIADADAGNVMDADEALRDLVERYGL